MKPLIHPILVLAFFCQILQGFASLLYSRDITALNGTRHDFPIENSIRVFEDPGCTLTIGDISGERFSSQFKKVAQRIPNFGFSRSVFWVRFNIRNRCRENSFWILEIANESLSHLSLYEGLPYNSITCRETGRLHPFTTRPVPGRGFLFDVSIPFGQTCTYYLRIQSEYGKPIPITVYTTPGFIKKGHTFHLVIGIGYGIIFMMIILHLYLFVKLQQRHYLFLSVFLFGFIGFYSSISGIATEYLWPGSPWWNSRCIHFFVGIISIFGNLFLMEFLQTRTVMVVWHRGLKCILVYSCIQSLSSVIAPVHVMIAFSMISAIIIPSLFIMVSLQSWRSGSQPSLYLFLAWVIFLTALMYVVLMFLQVVPYTTVLTTIAHINSVTFVMFFSIAFARRLFEKEKEMEASRELLNHAEKLATIGTLTASVAHEINNPNAALSLSLKTQRQAWDEIEPILDRYAKEQGEFEVGGLTWQEFREELRESLVRAAGNTERIKKIIADLRAFSRRNKESFEETVPLNKTVNDSILLVGNLIKKQTGRLILKLNPAIPTIKGNHLRLEQVIINLLQNAAQALEQPDQSITVSTSADRSSNRVILTVADEGVGMDTETLKHIFDPFFTTKGEKEGTGLGLSICKRIVEAHGGTLQVQSQPGKGTAVSVHLPFLAG